MHTEMLLGDMTLRIEESEDGAHYWLTVLVGDRERASIALGEVGAFLHWLHRDYCLFQCGPGTSEVTTRFYDDESLGEAVSEWRAEVAERQQQAERDVLAKYPARWLKSSKGEQPPAEPDEPGAGESPFAGEVPSWLSGPEPDESAGEMPSLLSGIRQAPPEPELDRSVWGEAIEDAFKGQE